MKAYAYLRVSTEEQLLGIRSQEEAIYRYMAYKKLPVTATFSDVGVSGGIPLGQRPRGSAMVNGLRPGDHVVIHKLDRAWRNVLDCLSVVSEWAALGVTLHVVDMNLDLATPYGKFFLTVAAAFAEMERGMISIRTKEGMARSDKRMGQLPYGDLPHEGETLARAADLRLQGMSWANIARVLDREGRATRSGKPWDRQVLQRICHANGVRA